VFSALIARQCWVTFAERTFADFRDGVGGIA
jgi:hypothetical protein